MIDIHIHTRFSFDSEEAAENYIARACGEGISVIGFSEHYDYDAFLDGAGIALADIPAYLEEMARLAAANPAMSILRGIEFGYCKAAESQYRVLSGAYPFDYVINSVHTLPDRGDCYYPRFFDGKTVRQSYLDYFNAVLQSVKASFDFQIVGHIGYVSRYCKGENAKIKYDDYREIFDEILKEIIRRDKCLEINTSSGGAGSDFLPDLDVVLAYLRLGGTKLSFASDAHRAEDYRRKAQATERMLKAEGVDRLCYYKDRRCVFYDL